MFCSASSWAFSCSCALVFLELFGQRLALLQQLLGAHGRGDRVEHDSDTLGQLIEKRDVNVGKLVEGGQFDHRLNFAFEQHRQHHDSRRRGSPQARPNLNVIVGNVANQKALFLLGALADQTLADSKLSRNIVTVSEAYPAMNFRTRSVLAALGDIEAAR